MTRTRYRHPPTIWDRRQSRFIVRLNGNQLRMAKLAFRMGPLMGLKVPKYWRDFRENMWFRVLADKLGPPDYNQIYISGGMDNEWSWWINGEGTLFNSKFLIIRLDDAK